MQAKELTLLIGRAKAGDEGAFASLYEEFFTPVYRYIYFRVKLREEAEDMAQNVFVKAYGAMAKYADSGKPLLAFFFTIARNEVIDHWRRKRPVAVSDEVLERHPSSASGPEELAASRHDGERLREKVLELPHDEQEAVVLRYFNGLSNAEAASIMGKREDAVRQLVSRALRSLRKRF